MTRGPLKKKPTCFSVFALLALLSPPSAWAQQELLVPDEFTTIQAAIDAAAAGDIVRVGPGIYQEKLTIKADIELRGDETARVILESAESGNAGTVLMITGVSDVTVRNLTFARGETGIAVDTSVGVEITNNVFQLGDNGTGIDISDQDSEVFIANNTFSNNETAIQSAASSNLTTIKNNIFSGNTTSLDAENGVDDISYNCYPTGETIINGDTDFAQGTVGFDNPGAQDYHLTASSDCIDLGPETDAIDETESDAGAYGGQLAEPNPFPPQQLTVTAVNNPGSYALQLQWRANNSYLLQYYKVYYGSKQSKSYNGGDAEDEFGDPLNSPFNVTGANAVTLYNLSGPAAAAAAPELSTPQPSYGQIQLSWSEVDEASTYIVYWGIASTDENRLDVGNVTSHTLGGLENGTSYQVQVSAVKQARYYLAVSAVATSYIDNPANNEIESAFSDEVAIDIGSELESPRSNLESAIPEEVIPFPNLPDQGDSGCFIATSAFGSRDTAEVLALRDFRDRVLMQYQIGRALIAFYYRHSPAMAGWLDLHDGLKPAVRAALAPIVWLAISLTYATLLHYVLVALLLGTFFLCRYHRIWRKQTTTP